MKVKFLAYSLGIAAALTGCAGSQSSLNNSMARTDANMNLAKEANVNPTTTASATAKIDSAKALKEDGEEEQAQILLDQTDLELRLAIATSERDAVKKEDQKLEAELRADVERKLLYQSILDNETKGAKK